jgi:hypothetical protein
MMPRENQMKNKTNLFLLLHPAALQSTPQFDNFCLRSSCALLKRRRCRLELVTLSLRCFECKRPSSVCTLFGWTELDVANTGCKSEGAQRFCRIIN